MKGLKPPKKNSNKKRVMNKKPLKSGLYPQTGLGGFYSKKKKYRKKQFASKLRLHAPLSAN